VGSQPKLLNAALVGSSLVGAAGWASATAWAEKVGLAGVVGALVVLFGKWLLGKIVDAASRRAEQFYGLPEKLAAFEARAVERFNHFEDQIERMSDKLEASNRLAQTLLDLLRERLASVESRLDRLEYRDDDRRLVRPPS
jgi:hypothetical protein